MDTTAQDFVTGAYTTVKTAVEGVFEKASGNEEHLKNIRAAGYGCVKLQTDNNKASYTEGILQKSCEIAGTHSTSTRIFLWHNILEHLDCNFMRALYCWSIGQLKHVDGKRPCTVAYELPPWISMIEYISAKALSRGIVDFLIAAFKAKKKTPYQNRSSCLITEDCLKNIVTGLAAAVESVNSIALRTSNGKSNEGTGSDFHNYGFLPNDKLMQHGCVSARELES